MKRWFSLIIAFILLTTGGIVYGMEPFRLTEYVTDRAQMLSETERDQLSRQLWEYAQKTTNQIVVVTVPSLEGEDEAGFAEKLFQLNKPGEKGQNNGIIFLIAQQERKTRLEVGYGLEEVVPDGKAGNILRGEVSPRFKAGDFYGGITAGVNAVIKSISPDYQITNQAPQAPARRKDRSLPGAFLVALILIGLSFLGNLGRGAQIHRRRHGRGFSEPWYWGGGGFGGGGFSDGGGSSGGGGFSGGGGDFGGGGASGDW